MTHTHYATIEAADGGRFDAYCAVPDRDPAPGVLLFQEIFGINDNIRGLAEKLADAGFLVLAPDMFWRLEPRFERKDESGLADAMSMVQRLDFTLARADIAATLARLRTMPGCTGRVGAVGFCLGGTLTFLAAATAKPDGRGLDAAVPYYGSGIHEMLELVPADRVSDAAALRRRGSLHHGRADRAGGAGPGRPEGRHRAPLRRRARLLELGHPVDVPGGAGGAGLDAHAGLPGRAAVLSGRPHRPQKAPFALASATLPSCSANVSAKQEVPSVWQRTKYSHGPGAGASAAAMASLPGAEIGVGGRPATT